MPPKRKSKVTKADDVPKDAPPAKRPRRRNVPASADNISEKIDALLASDAGEETFASSLGIDLGTSDGLYQLLVASLIFSARINMDIAASTAKLVIEKVPSLKDLKESTWDQRVEWLTEGKYTRYREKTATQLGELAEMLQEKGGSVEAIREAAGKDAQRERKTLKDFKGIGDVGVDIFLRDAQAVFDEVFPFAGKRDLASAKNAGLATTAKGLLEQVGGDKQKFLRLLTALIKHK
ncbi:hypothetical protein K488DRAFT_84034 [Vararia minispora EC-137]|uniref:Uncharacterized protein n=1 Tax=Vararia minispora EC-137 TaxID=1314806 RepID=A0ACB8QSS4_9AGAM|nr:hypothetical protein K488DRAFT_84034 [Vararia minispora EC-137]